MRIRHSNEIIDSKNRKESLEYLAQAIRIDPENKAAALKYAVPDESFESVAQDDDFKRITGG